ncbi:MAG: DUF1292 domain-containing protein [Clostridiales bacterium]|nr:DUF1292 domain-containing protein [Clostridiales bacterium]
MEDRPDKIVFLDPDTDEESEFFVLEQTCIAGVSYLLVAEDDEEDCDAYILRELRTDEDDIIYEIVEDDGELAAITKVFGELLEDIEFDF